MHEPGEDEHSAGAATSTTWRHVTVGLVVACYSLERLDDVLRLIESIGRQTSPIDEVVFVVQRSRELENAVEAALSQIRESRVTVCFLEEAGGVSLARNAGLAEATADIVAFADDDSVLAEDWAEMTRHFYVEHERAIGVAGAILPLWENPAMEWFPRELYWMLSCTYWTWTSPVPVRNGYGANMSFRREAFDGRRFSEVVGIGAWGSAGWRGRGGEEPELAHRVTADTGRPILYAPDIRAWHRVRPYRLRPGSLARRAYWEGRSKAALSHDGARTRGFLDTERGLLRDMLRGQLARVRLLLSRPPVALRQELLVLFVVALVGIGFIEERVRRRVGKAGHRQKPAPLDA